MTTTGNTQESILARTRTKHRSIGLPLLRNPA